MGRITIFTSDECVNCHRVTVAFAARQIPFREINLSAHPEKRRDVESMTNSPSVPQVFFNNRIVGGARETLETLERWDMDLFEQKQYNTLREMYDDLIGDVDKELDPRLRLSKVVPSPIVGKANSPDRKVDGDRYIKFPSKGGNVSRAKMSLDLLTFMPRADLTYHGTIYKNSFVGNDGVTAIWKHYGLASREAAVKFGKRLQRKKLLHHVTGDHAFDDTTDYYYRLQPYQNPGCLNTFVVWTAPVTTDPFSLVSELSRLLRAAESGATDEAGKVDYVKMGRSKRFFHFEEACCEVQGIDLGSMKECERIGFVINLYNLMVKHAFVKVGIPPNALGRRSFFAMVAYDVGGNVLTLDGIEHGVLRGNARGGGSLKLPFSKVDIRRRLSCTAPDPRSLLALDCGAKNSPVMYNLSSERLSGELQSIAESFCDDERNVQVDEDKHELRLSQMFNWYLKDFASSKDKLPDAVVSYLTGEKKATLRRMIESGRTVYVPVKYMEFDWSTNSSRSLTFECSSKLIANETIAAKLLRECSSGS